MKNDFAAHTFPYIYYALTCSNAILSAFGMKIGKTVDKPVLLCMNLLGKLKVDNIFDHL